MPVRCQCSNNSNIADFAQRQLFCTLATPLWCFGYCSLHALVLLSCIQKLCREESGARRICCNVEGPPGSAEEGSSPRPIKLGSTGFWLMTNSVPLRPTSPIGAVPRRRGLSLQIGLTSLALLKNTSWCLENLCKCWKSLPLTRKR